MRPPRKKASPKSGSTLDGDGLRAALAALCAKDDGVGVKELLIDQGVVVANEISHSRYAIESAYEADAVECFKAIDGLARAQGSKRGAIHQRLWGGQTPAMRCCLHSDASENGRGAPKCLAWILEREPLIALSKDEEMRSALDWAAMSPDPAPFKLLLSSLALAREQGLTTAGAIQQAASKAAFHAVPTTKDPDACMELLDSLAQVGVDWRALRSDALDWQEYTKVGDGQCLLGAAIDKCKHGPYGPRMVILMVGAGANPLSPYAARANDPDEEPEPAAPLAQKLLDPMGFIMMGLNSPRSAPAIKAIFDAIADTNAPYGGSPETIAPMPRAWASDSIRLVQERLGALREKAALDAAIGSAIGSERPRAKKPGL